LFFRTIAAPTEKAAGEIAQTHGHPLEKEGCSYVAHSLYRFHWFCRIDLVMQPIMDTGRVAEPESVELRERAQYAVHLTMLFFFEYTAPAT